MSARVLCKLLSAASHWHLIVVNVHAQKYGNNRKSNEFALAPRKAKAVGFNKLILYLMTLLYEKCVTSARTRACSCSSYHVALSRYITRLLICNPEALSLIQELKLNALVIQIDFVFCCSNGHNVVVCNLQLFDTLI